jgi:hypothetical protein
MRQTIQPTEGKKTLYTPIANNIYHDGKSYRVRVSKNKTMYSKNFSNKKKAIDYRNSILKGI